MSDKLVYGKGKNDMPKGWTVETDYNKRVHRLWSNMLRRCYSEKYQKEKPSYKDTEVCERWLSLSNFNEDIKKLENYNLWFENKEIYELDKDQLCKDKNMNEKIYSPETCKFMTRHDNTMQSFIMDKIDKSGSNNPNYGKIFSDESKKKMSEAKKGKSLTQDHKIKIGRSNPNAKQIVAINLKTNEIFNFDFIVDAATELGEKFNIKFHNDNITQICKSNHDPIAYKQKHGKNVKSVKGFTFYYKEDYENKNK